MGMDVADLIVSAEKNPAAGRDAPAVPVHITKVIVVEGTAGLTDDEKAAWDSAARGPEVRQVDVTEVERDRNPAGARLTARSLVKGVRVHNLKNLDLRLPRRRLVVVTGPSGSGKSSLAFDTLYAEGQRRYIESLSSYAHQFLDQLPKPDVDRIDGLSPALAIDQKGLGRSPRSTVGTVTEIANFLRLLFARCGTVHCPDCGVPAAGRPLAEIEDEIAALPEGTRFYLLAPVVLGRKGEHKKLLDDLRAQGYVRVLVDGELRELDEEIRPGQGRPPRHRRGGRRHDQPARPARPPQDRPGPRRRAGRRHGDRAQPGASSTVYSRESSCPGCGRGFAAPEPRLFSFNSPAGSCEHCNGLGTLRTIEPEALVPDETRCHRQGRRRVPQGQGDQLAVRADRGPGRGPGLQPGAAPSPSSTPRPAAPSSTASTARPPPASRPIPTTTPSCATGTGLVPELVRRHRETKSEKIRTSLERMMVERELPGLPRPPPAARGPERQGGRAARRRGRGPDPRRIRRLGRRPGVRRRARAHRGQAHPRADPPPPALPAAGGRQLPVPVPRHRHPFRRRGPAGAPGHPGGQPADGRALHPGRAQRGPAPPGHRAAGGHPAGPARPGQLGDRGGARPRRDAGGRPHHRPGAGGGGARRPHRGPGHGGRGLGGGRLAHRRLAFGPGRRRRTRPVDRRRPGAGPAGGARHARAQPQGRGPGDSPGQADGGHRRFGLGQEHRRARHPLPGPGRAQARRPQAARAVPCHRGRRTGGLGGAGGPVAHRPFAPFDPGHLHRSLQPHPPHLRRDQPGPHARLRRRPFQLQHRRRPLPRVRGGGPAPPDHGLPARRGGALRGVRRAPLRPRNPRGPLQGPGHRLAAGDDRRGGPRGAGQRARRADASWT